MKSLSFLKIDERETTILVPNSKVSDELYFYLEQSTREKINIQTISNFLERNYGEYESKSLLIRKLAFSFKKFFPDDNFDLFLRSYNFFTDLRSYSLSPELLDEVTESFDPKIKKAFQIFWMLSDSMSLVDEQKAYFELAHSVSLEENPLREKNYIFWGFQYLSSNQLNFIEALAMRNEVYIPLSENILNDCLPQDWPTWINFQKEIELDECKSEVSKENKITFFSKPYLNKMLKEVYHSTDSLLNKELVYMTKSLSIKDILKFPISDLQFKVSTDLYSDQVSLILSSIKINDSLNQNIEKVKKVIEGLLEKQNFRLLKGHIVLQKTLVSLDEWIDSETLIDEFYYSVIRECLNLDLPRVSFENAIYENNSIGISDLSNGFSKNIDELVLIADSAGGPAGGESNFEFEIEKKLMVIGPVKRNEFESLFFYDSFKQLSSQNQIHLFWESDLEETDPIWNRIFDDVSSFENVQKNIVSSSDKHDFNLSVKERWRADSISATKIQTYLDCPRKFYLQYIEKLKLDPALNENLAPIDLGLIAHKVIEVFYKEGNSDFRQEKIDEVTKSVLDEHLLSSKTSLSRQKYLTNFWELKTQAFNGINFVNRISKLKESSIEFERDLSGKTDRYLISGSIDCVIDYKDFKGILDFKRSSFSIPSKASVMNFSKVQLWFYFSYLEQLDHSGDLNNTPKFIGYVDLSDLENSILYFDSDLIKEFFMELPGKKYPIENLRQELLNYKAQEENYLKTMEQDKAFLPMPNDKNVCKYCLISSLCSKGSLNVS